MGSTSIYIIKSEGNISMNQENHWDKMAQFGASASVIDPSDSKGYKNRYIIELRNRAILNKLDQPKEARILDFGCGSGNLSELLSEEGFNVSGLDISSELIKLARERQHKNKWDVYQYDGDIFPFENNSFDAIITYVVLNHILNDSQFEETLSELYRVLKPGGQIIAIEQASRNITISKDGSKKQRKLSYFINSFSLVGFNVVTHNTLRRGHFPVLYMIRYGLIPPSLFTSISRFEALIGKIFKQPIIDYVDVLFSLKK